ncbi:hypothetical protein J437_LFUL016383 [Ladona fulva]|uniref:C-type lectin domain-containing protein n=1 Tax=Ladona fulva TaxID=123851 RepID=A0A8K0KK02_LADFU|nr:hypothetical protein J437_LFUL016383 [Ladona fulva]
MKDIIKQYVPRIRKVKAARWHIVRRSKEGLQTKTFVMQITNTPLCHRFLQVLLSCLSFSRISVLLHTSLASLGNCFEGSCLCLSDFIQKDPNLSKTMKRILTFVFLAALVSLSEQRSYSNNNGTRVANLVKLAHSIIPNDYTYIHGFGYYKLEMKQEIFENSINICKNSGAHLAIMNSLAEAEAVANLFPRNDTLQPDQKCAWLGLGDFFGKGEFYTIFGKPLSSTGYINWSSEEPRSTFERNCVWMNLEGKMGTYGCNCTKWFICEIELSNC